MADTEKATQEAPAPEPAPEKPATTPSTPASSGESKKKSKAPLIIGIIVVVILLLCGVCAAIGFFSKSLLGDTIRDAVSENISESIFESVIEESTGGEADVDISEDEFTWESDEGSGSIGSVTEWPDDIPSSIPEFTYGDIESQFSLSDETSSGWNLSFIDNDSDAISSYRDDFESADWDITGSLSMDDYDMFTAEKDSYSVTCSCDMTEDICSVIVSVTAE